jgi:hypothetical protein
MTILKVITSSGILGVTFTDFGVVRKINEICPFPCPLEEVTSLYEVHNYT